MPTRKITLKPQGECYVLSFMEELKKSRLSIEQAYKNMHDEFYTSPYYLPLEWWENGIQTTDLPSNYESYKSVKIGNWWLPASFIDYVE